MNEITIYGYSDDLVEVEGDVRAEFSANWDEPTQVIVESGGRAVGKAFLTYDSEGIWRVTGTFKWDTVTVEVLDVGEYEGAGDYSEALRIGSTEELSVSKA